MKKIVLTPNPYRDKSFKFVLTAQNCLASAGVETRICLPFDVDRGFDLPRGVTFSNLDRELPGADMLVCFGGDGTILHASKAATRAGVPVLGVNIGTVGFIAELESTELQLLRRIAAGEYEIERRKMLDVAVTRDGNALLRETCLNDVVITKGAVARVVLWLCTVTRSRPWSLEETASSSPPPRAPRPIASPPAARWWSRRQE